MSESSNNKNIQLKNPVAEMDLKRIGFILLGLFFSSGFTLLAHLLMP